MTPKARPTHPLRVFLALLLVWLLPSYLLGAVFLAQPGAYFAGEIPADLSSRLVALPIYGAVLGAPCLAAAAIGWVALHYARLASLPMALLLGGVCGAALAVFFLVAFGFQPGPIAAALLGAPLTALLVWTTAYARLAKPDPSLVFS